MFNVGPAELIVILLVALIIFGPKRLPEIGKTVGKGLREFRKATQDIRSDVEGAMSDDGTKPAAPSVSSDVSSTNGWGPDGTRIPTSEVPQVGSVPASPNGPAGEAGGTAAGPGGGSTGGTEPSTQSEPGSSGSGSAT